MRQTIGGTWLLQLMLLFNLLFVGFIILTLNYSKTIKLKNEMINMIEKYEGLNQDSIKLVNNFLSSSGYVVTSKCEAAPGNYGAVSLQSSVLEEVQEGSKYYYCVKKYKGANISNYYQITVFYKFNLPIIGDTSKFSIKGTTNNFQNHDENDYKQVIGD